MLNSGKTFRNCRLFFALAFLETNLASNHDTIMRIKRMASSTSLLESFFESAPQLLLQLSLAIEDDFMTISE